MIIGVLKMELSLPGCASLKEKRSRLKPFLARLHREFDVSAAEIDRHDLWGSAVVACAIVTNDAGHAEACLQAIVHWAETHWPDLPLDADEIEIIQ